MGSRQRHGTPRTSQFETRGWVNFSPNRAVRKSAALVGPPRHSMSFAASMQRYISRTVMVSNMLSRDVISHSAHAKIGHGKKSEACWRT